jgi:AcrR family transcriptional regulator
LFATRGFEQTTAAEIAQSVGLTERTFFRHFSDKREVLFYGQHQFLQAFVDGVDAAPPDASPLDVIASALHAAASFFPDERRPYSRTRQSVIDQNPALQERELHKLAGLAATVAGALRARGIGEPAATLAAESGATVFGIAFAQWIREGERRSLPDITSDVLHELLNLNRAATGSRKLL